MGHKAGLQADMGIAHIALQLGARHKRRHAVHHHDVNGVATDEVFADFQALLGGVRLGHQQFFDVHAALGGVAGVKRVFGVYVGGCAAAGLGACHDVVGECGFAGRFGAIDFHHAPARDAAHAERHIQGYGAGRDSAGAVVFDGVAEPHNRALPKVAVDLPYGELKRLSLVGRSGGGFL